jgi:hypothetical protein
MLWRVSLDLSILRAYKAENAALLDAVNSGAEGAWGSRRKSLYSAAIGQTVLNVAATII